ncbi:MAG TPA: hypothetical protein DCS93_31680 [Microscillaceae bacterium]|nr:hypothetical protein [Microscillaceae bacterium]
MLLVTRDRPIFLLKIMLAWWLVLPALVVAQTPSKEVLLLQLQVAQKEDTIRVKRLNQVAQWYLKNQPDTSLRYAQEALQLAQKLNDRPGQALGLYNLGRAYYSHSNFNQAINQYLAALELYQNLQHKEGQARVHNALGQVYYYSSQISSSLKAHQQALALYQQRQNKRGEAEALGYIGHIYEKKSAYAQALAYQQSALEIYQALDDKTGLSKIYDNLGSIYEDQENYDKAFEYFNKAYLVNKALNNQLEMMVNLNDLGDIYRKKGAYPQALKHTQQAYDLAKQLNQKYQMRSALRDLSKTQVLLKDYKKAHELLEQSYLLYADIYDEENARQIARMQTLYETSQKEKQIAVLEKDQKIALIFRYLFAGGALMLLIIGWVIFSRQRLKIKSNREIIEQNKRIYEAQQALVQTELENTQLNEQKLKTELENKQLKEQNMQAELEAKSKELTTHALHIIQKNKMLEELKDCLRDIKRQDKKDAHKQIQQAINMINYSFSMDKDWEDFKKVFEEVHQAFFTQLQEKHPGLTPAETRLCALIKLKLNSKDIAAIMGISQDSLRIARYRLRKKLQLPKEIKLNNFVGNIG